MEQQTRSKLTKGTLFVIFLIVIYFGNIGSIRVLDDLEQTNQKLDHLITEIGVLKSKVDRLERTPIDSKFNNHQGLEPPQQRIDTIVKKRVIDVEQNAVNQNIEQYPETVLSLVDVAVVEERRVECCELDEWAEIQQVRIRDIVNEVVSRENASIVTENIQCESNTCSVDLNVAGENGMLLINTIVGDLNEEKSLRTKIKSITRDVNEFGVVLEINKVLVP